MKLFKKIAGLALGAAMIMSMAASAFAGNGTNSFVAFYKTDGGAITTDISMTTLAIVDGTAENPIYANVNATNKTIAVVIDEFTVTKKILGIPFTGTGSLTGLTFANDDVTATVSNDVLTITIDQDSSIDIASLYNTPLLADVEYEVSIWGLPGFSMPTSLVGFGLTETYPEYIND